MVRRATHCLGRWLIPAAALLFSSQATGAADGLPRIIVLPLADRASIVIEAESPLENVTETREDCPRSTAECLIAEGGPIAKSTPSREMIAAPSIRLVRSVSLTPYTRPDGQTYFRLRVQLRDRCEHALRLSGNRLYIDFAPIRQTRSATGSESPVANAAREPFTPSTAPASPGGKTPPEGRRPEVLDYETLKADVLRRAQQRARQPDVKGLLALVAEVRRKDEQLGHQRPDLVAELLEEVNRLLDEARLLQLEVDRQAFRKADGSGKK